MVIKDNVLDLDGGRVEKIRVSQKLFQENKYFRTKAGRWECAFNIEMDDKNGDVVFTTGLGDFKMSLRHKNAGGCQRRQVDIWISRS